MTRTQPAVSCLAVALIAGLGLLVWSGTVEAQTKADPFSFGLGTLASWTRDAGNPAAGDTNQNGLYLQKNTATATFAAAGASLTPLPSSLTGGEPPGARHSRSLAFPVPTVNRSKGARSDHRTAIAEPERRAST